MSGRLNSEVNGLKVGRANGLKMGFKRGQKSAWGMLCLRGLGDFIYR